MVINKDSPIPVFIKPILKKEVRLQAVKIFSKRFKNGKFPVYFMVSGDSPDMLLQVPTVETK